MLVKYHNFPHFGLQPDSKQLYKTQYLGAIHNMNKHDKQPKE